MKKSHKSAGCLPLHRTETFVILTFPVCHSEPGTGGGGVGVCPPHSFCLLFQTTLLCVPRADRLHLSGAGSNVSTLPGFSASPWGATSVLFLTQTHKTMTASRASYQVLMGQGRVTGWMCIANST